jgi:hypothetical protein
MRPITYLIGAIALGLLTACAPKPASSLEDVVALVAANDWDQVEVAVKGLEASAAGCDLALAHALGAGLERTRMVSAITKPVPEQAELQRAAFWSGYEDAIAQANRLGDCGFRSLTESELEVGG